jgi:hypothetical protein
MSNKRILDRMVTPEWMSTALRIARLGKPWDESRHLLEIALRDEIESKTGRRKTATVLAGSWLKPAPEAESLVGWAGKHAGGDVRVWHLGVMMANYTFFAELCAEIGRGVGLAHDVDTVALRSTMKSQWGDRDVVNVATRSGVRTLRYFGVLLGDEGDSRNEVGTKIPVERQYMSWVMHALMVARGRNEIDVREALRAPELFMFDLPSSVGNGYPNLEQFTEGSGRTVLGIVRRRELPPPPRKQMGLDLEIPDHADLDLDI